jgi:hypothetical protein
MLGSVVERGAPSLDRGRVSPMDTPTMRKIYDDSGRVASAFYCSQAGDAVAGPDLWHKVVYEYDAEGRVASESYYSGEGLPCVDAAGIVKRAFSYDPDGEEIRREEYLSDGRIRIVKRNARGEVGERKYASSDGSPALGDSGYYCMKFSYDDEGRLEKQVCYGLDGKRCRNSHGYAAFVCQYGEDGSCRTLFLDERGRVVGEDAPEEEGGVQTDSALSVHSSPGEREKVPLPVRPFQGVKNARGEKILPRERKRRSSSRPHKDLQPSVRPVERLVAPPGENAASVWKRRRTTLYVTGGILAALLFVFSVVKILPVPLPPVEISVYMVSEDESEAVPEMTSTRVNHAAQEETVSMPEVSSAPVLTAEAAADVSLPNLDVDVSGMVGSEEMMFGESLGGGASSGGIASIVESRCSPGSRMARIREGGGNPEAVEKTVIGMLRWLKGKQGNSGAWGEGGSSVVNSAYPVGTTAICLLAFSAHCETVTSEEFGTTVARAIAYLATACMNPSRKTCVYLPGYEYAMAVYALAESYGLSHEKGEEFPLDEKILLQFAEYILKCQNREGSWDYQYGMTPGDISISCWNIQALCALRRAGIDPDGYDEAMAKAAGYVRSCWLPKRGTFHYRTQERSTNCSIPFVGVYSGKLLGVKYSPAEENTMKKLVASVPEVNVNKSDYHSIPPNAYVNYYHGQIARLQGGNQWQGFERRVMGNVMRQTQRSKTAQGREEVSFGDDMPPLTHAFWTLVLSMYYRYVE